MKTQDFIDLRSSYHSSRNYFLSGDSDVTFPNENTNSAWAHIDNYHIEKLQGILKKLSTDTLSISLSDPFELLARVESFFQKTITQIQDKESLTTVVCTPRSPKTTGLDLLLHQKMRNELKSLSSKVRFLVQGSFGDGTAILGISDVDLVIILPQDIAENPDALRSLRQIHRQNIWPTLLNIDPSQHHGAYIYSEIDLAFWSERYLPVTCLKNSMKLNEFASNFELNVVSAIKKSPQEFLEQSLHSIQNFESFLKNGRAARETAGSTMSAFYAKYYTQVGILFPAIFFFQLGHAMYKPIAIDTLKAMAKTFDCLEVTDNLLLLESKRHSHKNTSLSIEGALSFALKKRLRAFAKDKYKELRIEHRKLGPFYSTQDVFEPLERFSSSVDQMMKKIQRNPTLTDELVSFTTNRTSTKN
jgi:hypothetical protein